MRAPRITPVARISLGLTSLVLMLLLIVDFVGLVPDHLRMAREVRHRTSQAVAIQTAALLPSGDPLPLARAYEDFRAGDPDVLSLAFRLSDGQIFVAVGEHARHWHPLHEERSLLDHVQVPVFAGRQPWGQVEIAFQPIVPTTFLGWLRYPTVVLMLVLTFFAYIGFYLYMRRALQYLDPTTAVPERVRQAFDTLTDGIAIVDRDRRLMLTNKTFNALHPAAALNLIGRPINEQRWLCECLGTDVETLPWERAMRENCTQSGVICDLQQPAGDALKLIVQASPIVDPKGLVRGCLVSVDNVTQVHRINEELRQTLVELEASREQIRQQNIELHQLASRDPLTGCLNRRAFFEVLEGLFLTSRKQGKNLCCIMCDIDHFKRFNDRYGHAVGDEVIRALVRTLQAVLRQHDLLCRYGGEEFCIILPETTLAQAAEIAARLRSEVELHAGTSVRTTEGLQITSSFGLAALAADMHDPAELIDRADSALYQSKEGGRNRVTIWQA